MLSPLLAALALFAAPVRAQDHEHHHHHENAELSSSGPALMDPRDASGTAWQPESTPHEASHYSLGPWMVMAHGYANGIYDKQGGPRGGEKWLSQSMLMVIGRRELAGGVLGVRTMTSLDPAMGKNGYPLLLQTGETADGRSELVDRQHPHDLFMELALVYRRAVAGELEASLYAGLPGEPALGPPAFMMRASGVDDPQAPLSHHWLDSTHITMGVATGGLIWRGLKLEGSGFRGREPDQHRWDLEKPDLDSWSTRLSYNPTRDWALQVSYGKLHEPEQLHPGEDLDRVTASASWNARPGDVFVQTTAAFGRNKSGHHGEALDALLLESAAHLRGHTLFGRVERVEKNELFPEGDPLEGVYTVGRVSLGYLYDFARWKATLWSAGLTGSLHFLPSAIRPAYGGGTPGSILAYARVKLL